MSAAGANGSRPQASLVDAGDGCRRATRVVVIGGGLAGITAALDCADAGAQVTLLESRGRLGGAAYSFARHGLTVDNGQHVFLRCCSEYTALLQRIGATRLVTMQPCLEIPVLAPGGRTAWLRRDSLPAPLHLARALCRYPYVSLPARTTLALTMQRLRRVDPSDPEADKRSFGDWLAEHRQSAAAIEAVWELIGRPTLNLRVRDASLAQAAYVFQEGLLKSPSAGDVGYARVPLGEIHDVAARVALAAAGVECHLRRGAAAIIPDGTGFRVPSSGAPVCEAEAVIVAVRHDQAARLLPAGAGVRRLSSLGSSPIVNLHVVYDRRVLEHAFAATVASPVQWVFDRTASAGLSSGQYLAVSLSAADEELNMTAEDLRARFLPALADVLPAAAPAEIVNFFVTREHAATFRAAPGARSLRPGPGTALPGLALAGTFTDTGWPATMESAVRSGHAAAAQALRSATLSAQQPRAAVAA